MTSAEFVRSPTTVAVLVVRAWREESTDPPRVRIRLTGRLSVESPIEETRLVDTVDGALTWIKDWFDRVEPANRLD